MTGHAGDTRETDSPFTAVRVLLERNATLLEAHIEQQESSEQAMKVLIERLDQAIFGSEVRPGIMIRLDRIEQSEKRKTKVVSALGVISVTAFFQGAWELIKKHWS